LLGFALFDRLRALLGNSDPDLRSPGIEARKGPVPGAPLRKSQVGARRLARKTNRLDRRKPLALRSARKDYAPGQSSSEHSLAAPGSSDSSSSALL
jgi:hypothetical protein